MTKISLPVSYTMEALLPRKRKSTMFNVVENIEFDISNPDIDSTPVVALLSSDIVPMDCIRQTQEGSLLKPVTNKMMRANTHVDKDIAEINKNSEKSNRLIMDEISNIELKDGPISLLDIKVFNYPWKELHFLNKSIKTLPYYFNTPECKTILSSNRNHVVKGIQEQIDNMALINGSLYETTKEPCFVFEMSTDGVARIARFSNNGSNHNGIDIPIHLHHLISEYPHEDTSVKIEIMNNNAFYDNTNIIVKSILDNITSATTFYPNNNAKKHLDRVIEDMRNQLLTTKMTTDDIRKLQKPVTSLINSLYNSTAAKFRTLKEGQFLFNNRLADFADKLDTIMKMNNDFSLKV